MAQPTLTIKDAGNVSRTVYTHNPNGSAVMADSAPVTLSTDQPPITVLSTGGLGSLALVPAASTNGTVLGSKPATAVGARIYLTGTEAVTFTIASSAPSTAPTVTYTISNTNTGPNWDENLSGGQMMYITALTGTPKFRWI
jgi:hypothetical protein